MLIANRKSRQRKVCIQRRVVCIYISRVIDEEYCPFYRGNLFGRRSTQGVEVMDEGNKPVRNLGLPNGFVAFIQMDAARHAKAASQAARVPVTSLVPNIKQKINQHRNEALNASSLVRFNDAERKKKLYLV